MAEKVYDDEDFEINPETQERVLDDDGNPILKPEEPEIPEETEEEKAARLEKEAEGKETPEEAVARLEREKAELERVNQGRLGEIKEQRDKRREAEEELKRKASPSPTANMTAEEKEEWLNSPPTRKEIIEELNAMERESDTKITQGQQANSERDAKRNHKDYDEVIKMADEILDKNPGLKSSLGYAKDFGESKYAIGQTHPSYIEKVKEATRKEIVANLEKGGKKPVRIAGKAGTEDKSGDDLTLEDLQKMSPKVIAALPESTRERLLGATAEMGE